ncbi:MAG: DUF2254 domain-containing protein [Candidatus Limnocylindrales bacterium]
MIDLAALREWPRQRLWFVPALLTLGAGLLAVVLVALDLHLAEDPGWLGFAFGGTAEGAQNVLSVIATSMLTFTGLVFSITMLVLQAASSQLSPQVMRTFLRDRGNQVVLGLFVATFVYTLLVLHEVRAPSEPGGGFVPSLSILIAFVLLLSSVGAFIWYIDHMAHAIRASTVIESIWAETTAAIDRLYPEPIGAEAETEAEPWQRHDDPARVVESPGAGTLVGIDEERLLAAASEGDRLLELLPSVGAFVPEGAPLARLWGDWDEAAIDDVRAAVGLGSERTLNQDAAFGLRQLVDIALRALSPGINDPSTAVLALDRLHDLLRRLAVRRLPSRERVVDGTVRLVLSRPGWDEYVRLAVDEIRQAGDGQIQVDRRLRSMLEDLRSIAPEDRLAVLRQERGRLDPSD